MRSTEQDSSAVDYARAIEERWAALVERPLILSRRDWSHVSRWHDHGVPLELIDEALRAAVQPERGRGPRGLSQIAAAVDESWSLILQGRLASDGVDAGPPRIDPSAAWRARVQREKAGSDLAEILTQLLDRLDRGEDPALLDLELDGQLARAAPAELLDRVLRELHMELATHADRMSPERLNETRERASRRRLRQALNLPRLADTPAAE